MMSSLLLALLALLALSLTLALERGEGPTAFAFTSTYAASGSSEGTKPVVHGHNHDPHQHLPRRRPVVLPPLEYRMTGVLEVRGGGNGGSSGTKPDRPSSSPPPLSIPLDVLTIYDPSSASYRQRVSYHRGLEVDYRVNGTSYKLVHRNGGMDRICLRENQQKVQQQHEGGGMKSGVFVGGAGGGGGGIVNFFPTPGELKLYRDDGIVTSDPGVPYVLLTRNVSHSGGGGVISLGSFEEGTTAGAGTGDGNDRHGLEDDPIDSIGGMPPYDHLEFRVDAVGMDPVQWRMLSRNRILSAHTDDWVMTYQSFEPILGDRERELHVALFDDEFSDACGSDAAVENVVAGLGGVNFNRLGMVFSSSPPFPSSSSSSSSKTPPSSVRLGRPGADEMKEDEDEDVVSHSLNSGGEEGSVGSSITHGGGSYRSPTYLKNLEKIRELNDLHRGPGRDGATFRPYTRFLDMEVDEVLTYHGGLRRPRRDWHDEGGEEEEGGLFHYFEMPPWESDDELSSLPDSFDWREHMPGSVGPVKDQGICGSCWAFSLVGAIESHWYIRHRRSVTLPEQFVVDCTWGGTEGGNAGCDGGLEEEGAMAILDRYNGSIPTREAYGGYLSVDGRCYVDDIPSQPSSSGDNVRIDGWTRVRSRDEEAVKHALYTRGPLSVSINVVDALVYYSSGVVDVDECSRNGIDDLDHAVVLVGWGSSNATTTTATAADEGDGRSGSGGRGAERMREHWILRNSWSTLWGDDGYFRIAMGENDCGVTTAAGFPVVAEGVDSDMDSDLVDLDVGFSSPR